MLLHLNPSTSESITSQIVSGIEELIAKGYLTIGNKLPSCDEMAGKIGAHRLTVLSAYKELGRRGRVSSNPGRGTIVIQNSNTIRQEVLEKLVDEIRKKGSALGLSPQEIAEAVISPKDLSKKSLTLSAVFPSEWDLFAPITQHH